MSVNGDVADKCVTITLELFETAVKITGTGVKNIAAMMYAISKDSKTTKGKIKLNNLIKSGKPLKIFTLKSEDLKRFAKEAKNYGISYCALIKKKNKSPDGIIDLLVKDEDAPRINRIVERFKLITVDTAKVELDTEKLLQNKEMLRKEMGTPEKSKEEQLEEVLANKSISKEQNLPKNFNVAKTEKSSLSEPFLKTTKMQEGVSKGNKKPSVKKELAELKEKARKLDELKSKDKAVNLGGKNSAVKHNKKVKSNR